MATKARYKRFDGSVWVEYHFATDWTQVENVPLTLTNIASLGSGTNNTYLRKTGADTWQLRTAANVKSDIGLGSVSNYGIASQAQAEAGTVNTVYMTPLRTKQAIDVNIGNLVTTNTVQDINERKNFESYVYFGDEIEVNSNAYFSSELLVESDFTAKGYVRFYDNVDFKNIVNFSQATVTGLAGRLKQIRTRTTTLTAVNSGTTVGTVTLDSGQTVATGDKLIIEVGTQTNAIGQNTQLIMIDLNKVTATSDGTPAAAINFTAGSATAVGSYTYRNYSFTPYSTTSSTIGFNNKFLLTGIFTASTSTIAWTNAAYTLYIGNIWKVE